MIDDLFIMVCNLFSTIYNLFIIIMYKEKELENDILIDKIKRGHRVQLFRKIGS